MRNPTPFRSTAHFGSNRHIQPLYIHPASTVGARSRYFTAPFFVLMLTLCAVLTLSCLSRPALAANTDITNLATDAPQPTAPKTLSTLAAHPNDAAETTAQANNATYIYISCPLEIYRGTLSENVPAEVLIDDFEELPEHWLYVLTPLPEDENYFFTLDLACRTESAPFKGQISATYSSYVPDDGSLGSVRIEAAEEIAPDTFLVYYGELKYISDGTLHLTQNGYGSLYNHHLFYFSLTTTDLPAGTEPLGEQRLSRLSDPAANADVSIIGDAERLSSVYDEDLLNSDYMYPYYKYNPAEGSRPETSAATLDNPPEPLDAAALDTPPEPSNSVITPDAYVILGMIRPPCLS